MEVVLKNEESKCRDLDTRLQASARDGEEKANTIKALEAGRSELEAKVKDSERRADELQKSLEKLAEKSGGLETDVAELRDSLSAERAESAEKDQQVCNDCNVPRYSTILHCKHS